METLINGLLLVVAIAAGEVLASFVMAAVVVQKQKRQAREQQAYINTIRERLEVSAARDAVESEKQETVREADLVGTPGGG